MDNSITYNMVIEVLENPIKKYKSVKDVYLFIGEIEGKGKIWVTVKIDVNSGEKTVWHYGWYKDENSDE